MNDVEREVLRDEYYVQGRPELPGHDELVGQDLIKHRRQQSLNPGSLEEGYSNDHTLCIVDPRPLRRPTRMITHEIRRLNENLAISRSVDLAVHYSQDKSAIEGLLTHATFAIWEIRTGEIACNDVQDMIHNLTVFTKRLYLAKGATLRARRRQEHARYIREYYGLLERYYVRMYAQELREEFFQQHPKAAESWDNHELALMSPGTPNGRIMDLEGPGIQMFQLDSSVGRARSRSREPDF